jgi:uncharacterized protein (TIGR02246 family)
MQNRRRNMRRNIFTSLALTGVLAATMLPTTFARADDTVDQPAANADKSIPAGMMVKKPASEPSAETEAVHNELRALRDRLLAAVNKNDIDAVVALLHPNIVYTAQDAVVSRGRDGVKAYLDKMLKGPQRVVESFKTNTDVSELTTLYADNNVGVAFGTTSDEFKLTSGVELKLESKWTATLVKENGQWLIAAFHISGNLFENPLMEMQAKKAKIFGAGGLFLGALLMMILIRIRNRPATNNA